MKSIFSAVFNFSFERKLNDIFCYIFLVELRWAVEGGRRCRGAWQKLGYIFISSTTSDNATNKREVEEGKKITRISTYDDNDDKKKFVVRFLYTSSFVTCMRAAKGNASDSLVSCAMTIFNAQRAFWIHRRLFQRKKKKEIFYHDVGDKKKAGTTQSCDEDFYHVVGLKDKNGANFRKNSVNLSDRIAQNFVNFPINFSNFSLRHIFNMIFPYSHSDRATKVKRMLRQCGMRHARWAYKNVLCCAMYSATMRRNKMFCSTYSSITYHLRSEKWHCHLKPAICDFFDDWNFANYRRPRPDG